MAKELTLKERKQIQLKMLEEFHAFCTARNIRYSLAFGTLLGAIRHKGFIPWDDDVDIIITEPDMMRLKKELHSDTLKYCDVDTEPHFAYSFSRIAYKPTYQKIGRSAKMYGVNIDLYPIIPLPKGDEAKKAYFSIGEKLMKKRRRYIRVKDALARRCGINNVPGFDKAMKAYRDHMFLTGCTYEDADRYLILCMGIKNCEIVQFDFDLFRSTQLTEFEGRQFMIISDYDTLLHQKYGDYMTPPPEKDRHPYHGGHYFWYDK